MSQALPPFLVIDLCDAMRELRQGLPELQPAAHTEMLRQVFDYFFNSPQGKNPFAPTECPFLVSSMLPGMFGTVVTDEELNRLQNQFYGLYRAVTQQLIIHGLDRLVDSMGDLPYVLYQLPADHRIILRLIAADQPRY